jgi:hypothetical protein
MVIHIEGNHGVILGLDQESWYPDSVQELVRGLGGIVIGRGSEAEGRRGELVVKVVDRIDAVQFFETKRSRRQPLLHANAFLQPAEKPSGVNNIGRMVDSPGAGGEIDGRRDRHDSGDKILGGLAQFAGQLQDHITAERESSQEERLGAFQPADDGEEIGSLAGMIERLAADVLSPAAASHVESVYGEPVGKCRLRQAARVSGIAGTFQAMNQDQLRARFPFRPL